MIKINCSKTFQPSGRYKSNAGTSVCSESSSYPFVLENEIIPCDDDATLRIDEQLELKVLKYA
jgi:hypothetical protein